VGVVENCTAAGTVHLSIDDGPNGFTEETLDILAQYNAVASFWLIGQNVQGRESTVRRIVDEGHYIGSHSWSHAHFNQQSPEFLRDELTKTYSVIFAATGGKIKVDRFRPPYGDMNRNVLSTLSGAGYTAVMWNFDTEDWKGDADHVKEIVDSYLDGFDPAVNGFVILMHLDSAVAVSTLPYVLSEVQARGYVFQAAEDCWNPKATPDIHPVNTSAPCNHPPMNFVHEGWCSSKALCGEPGACCSQSGYCGKDADYCGAGCQNGACTGCTFWPRPPDVCASNPCEHGGTCVNTRFGFMCACPGGSSGPTCNSTASFVN